MHAPAELVETFRAAGLKVTPQRELIFRLLHGADAHPTAEAIFDEARREMPTISLRTVYQTLNDLVRMGEVLALDLGTGSARFDPNSDLPHHHLVCTRCGSVRDVYVRVRARMTDEQLDGFRPSSTEVIVRGLCATCVLPANPSEGDPLHG